MRAILLVPAIGVLAACEPEIPDSGVGFNTPEYQVQREAALATGQTLNGDPLVPPAVVSSETLDPVTGQPVTATAAAGGLSDAEIARQAETALLQSETGSTAVQSGSSTAQAVQPSNSGISDEQDFDAVSNRQSIQSDAERIAQNRANYQVVTPTALPQRDGSSQPNIVQYALNTSHPRGTQMHSRAGFNLQAKAQRNCAGYASPDLAQIAFLGAGGPQKDRKGLDPDGDGYACTWDPTPFRRAVQN